ncbi:MAG: hypothetical protein QNK15_08735 [Cycloclasticus sp.]|nr:hypothetical protein [Cycloclasticus sp.]
MTKKLLILLIFIMVIAPVVSASSHCASMDMVGGMDVVDTTDMQATNGHEHHAQADMLPVDSDNCDCAASMDCAGHVSAYVMPYDIAASRFILHTGFLTHDHAFPPSEIISPEIRPPSLSV